MASWQQKKEKEKKKGNKKGEKRKRKKNKVGPTRLLLINSSNLGYLVLCQTFFVFDTFTLLGNSWWEFSM